MNDGDVGDAEGGWRNRKGCFGLGDSRSRDNGTWRSGEAGVSHASRSIVSWKETEAALPGTALVVIEEKVEPW